MLLGIKLGAFSYSPSRFCVDVLYGSPPVAGSAAAVVENPSKDKVDRAKRESESVTDDGDGERGKEVWIFKSYCPPCSLP